MAITTPAGVDYHLSNSTGNLSINPLNPVSLVVWINGGWTDGATYAMVGTYNTSTSGGTAVQVGTRSETPGAIVVWTWGGGHLVDTAAATGNIITLTTQTWYHVAYTFDGTLHNIYVNGALINTVNNTTGTSTITGKTGYAAQLPGTITAVFINGYPGGGVASETATFSFSDISHFSRCLSAGEILTMYSVGGPKDGIISGEASSYFCNEGTPGSVANNITDETGGGNTLTTLGGATGVNFTYSTDPFNGDARPPL